MKSTFLTFALFLSLLTFGQSKEDKASIAKLDAIFQKALTDFNVPGMAIAIVKDDQVLLSKGYGVKNANSNEKVTDKTSFAIASNSKAFTSAALAILVDEGKIKWSDKVRDYLPYFELYSPYVSEEMTIRDLLCHRTGLATFSGDLIWYGTSHSREEIIRRAKYLEPVYGFRESFGYSNIMFLAAGEIIPVVTGKTWDEFIRERFFTPLGMNNANTTIRDFKPGQDIAAPHNEVNGKNIPIEYVNWDNVSSAGSINASVSELTQWIKLQLHKGTLDGKTYWTEQRSNEMWENNTPTNVSKWQRTNMPSRHFNGYGLGWSLMEYGGEKIVSHGGGYDGMISQTILIPGKNIGFVILTNNINSLPSCLMFSVLDEFLKVKNTKDWPAMFLEFKKADELAAKEAEVTADALRAQGTKPSLALEKYEGTYSSEMYGDVEVKKDADGNLTIDFKPTALFKGTLSHWHYDTFQLAWTTQMMLPKGSVTFVINAQGEVSEMKVVVENPDFDFTELKLLKK
jgi:CubicO group peptidase (beta-lactamase class C family)